MKPVATIRTFARLIRLGSRSLRHVSAAFRSKSSITGFRKSPKHVDVEKESMWASVRSFIQKNTNFNFNNDDKSFYLCSLPSSIEKNGHVYIFMLLTGK